jgi:hypothetical protein
VSTTERGSLSDGSSAISLWGARASTCPLIDGCDGLAILLAKKTMLMRKA